MNSCNCKFKRRTSFRKRWIQDLPHGLWNHFPTGPCSSHAALARGALPGAARRPGHGPCCVASEQSLGPTASGRSSSARLCSLAPLFWSVLLHGGSRTSHPKGCLCGVWIVLS